MTKLKIGIAGGGIGGMAAAIALIKAGHEVEVFERATDYKRVGADINLTPNAVHALDRLGVVPALKETAARPTHRISRMWDTGKETSRLKMADEAERKYGVPQLTIHRADLLDALRRQLDESVVKLGDRIETLECDAAYPRIRFVDGGEREVELLIGADGIYSRTRTAFFGPKRYEDARKERTARVQIGSHGNKWLREGGNADWVYGYDADAVKWGIAHAQQ